MTANFPPEIYFALKNVMLNSLALEAAAVAGDADGERERL